MKSLRQIEEQLFDDLARTKQAYDEARKVFLQVNSDIPSGLPPPDGAARITNAGQRNSVALEEYVKALQECNEFMLYRLIPKRLRDEPARAADANETVA